MKDNIWSLKKKKAEKAFNNIQHAKNKKVQQTSMKKNRLYRLTSDSTVKE